MALFNENQYMFIVQNLENAKEDDARWRGSETVLKEFLFFIQKWRNKLGVATNGLGFDLIISIWSLSQVRFCGKTATQNPCRGPFDQTAHSSLLPPAHALRTCDPAILLYSSRHLQS